MNSRLKKKVMNSKKPITKEQAIKAFKVVMDYTVGIPSIKEKVLVDTSCNLFMIWVRPNQTTLEFDTNHEVLKLEEDIINE